MKVQKGFRLVYENEYPNFFNDDFNVDDFCDKDCMEIEDWDEAVNFVDKHPEYQIIEISKDAGCKDWSLNDYRLLSPYQLTEESFENCTSYSKCLFFADEQEDNKEYFRELLVDYIREGRDFDEISDIAKDIDTFLGAIDNMDADDARHAMYLEADLSHHLWDVVKVKNATSNDNGVCQYRLVIVKKSCLLPAFQWELPKAW